MFEDDRTITDLVTQEFYNYRKEKGLIDPGELAKALWPNGIFLTGSPEPVAVKPPQKYPVETIVCNRCFFSGTKSLS